jgi:predicted phage terminase large subunit-like protein
VWPQFIAGEHHRIMANAFERIIQGKLKRLIISMPPRHAFALDTLVPTTQGFKRIDEIQVGDYLFGPDGEPTMCEATSEVYEDVDVWRVTTNDGASVVVDAAHFWNVALDRKRPVFKNKSTVELWERQEKGARPPRLPDYEAMQQPEADLPVDPYLLGVWLGDGHHQQAVITKNDEDAAHIRSRIEQKGWKTTDQATRMTFGVLGLKVLLREIGVLGNKHIPEQYLFASERQRRELLYGLMDTDGNVTKAGQCFYNTSSKVLRDQALTLMASLGIKGSVATCNAMFDGRSYGDYYRISFYDPDSCTLPRKRLRSRETLKPVHRNIRFEKAGKQDTKCIKVDRDDGLFMVTDRFIVSHNTKSEFGSWLLPSWFLGHFPDKKILHASHTQDLTANFGRKIRDLIDEDGYHDIFPETILKSDAKSSGKWQTSRGGQYYAAGVGGALAGRGADLAIIDDPISEQDVTDAAFDQCWEWFQSGPRQRLQPGGIIVIIMTRWAKKDLVGKLLTRMEKDPLAEQYEYIEFPALLYEEGYEGNDTHIIDSLWPEYWDKESMLAVKRSISPHLWNAQYMQHPTGKGSTIIPKEYIKRWPADKRLPDIEFLLHSYDPAFEQKESQDPTGFTKWGAFRPVGIIDGKRYDGSRLHFICLGSLKKRLDFPELKRMAISQYRVDKPDTVVIEKRASGLPMVQELQRAGLFVETFTPHRGTGDKAARLNAVSSMFEEGLVWVPDGPLWAEELVEDLVGFPNMEDDDLVDSTTIALNRFKRGNLVSFNTDDEDEDDDRPMRSRRYYNV